ncbi:leucine rich repeat-containing protein [Besnoitia besnoiti]|uniref:Leucine rich repeat-containing protein n=1 Tax=Besnoitia besnoiti TaxID=94643 RepID=A0A2A9MLZ1_BESBE|nr:leucine rich repeat-containing protein [Besnoitia besnoiti]PFH36502.1 leucine rich repeat-containing protein [Besnoitia besnoiti]
MHLSPVCETDDTMEAQLNGLGGARIDGDDANDTAGHTKSEEGCGATVGYPGNSPAFSKDHRVRDTGSFVQGDLTPKSLSGATCDSDIASLVDPQGDVVSCSMLKHDRGGQCQNVRQGGCCGLWPDRSGGEPTVTCAPKSLPLITRTLAEAGVPANAEQATAQSRASRALRPTYVERAHFPKVEATETITSMYRRLCREYEVSPNPLLLRAFEASDPIAATSVHRCPSTITDVDCPGNVKPVFCQRLDDLGVIPAVLTLVRCGPQLRSLNFSYNNLSDDGAFSLSTLVAECPVLRSLNLRANNIGSEGAGKLVEGLIRCSTIEDLDMSLNPIGCNGAIALAKWLRINQSLKRLSVDSCQIDWNGLIAIATALKEQNRTVENLSIANLAKIAVQPDHCFHWGSMVAVNNKLTNLCLAKQGVKDQGIKVLVPFLKQNKALTKLDLSCNQITFFGAKAICDLLRANTPIQVLNLDCNRLGGHGARYLATGIRENHRLECLHLNNNGISPLGLVDLAEALLANCCLRQVTLAVNDFDSKSAAAFSKLTGPETPRVVPLQTDFKTYEVDARTLVCNNATP